MKYHFEWRTLWLKKNVLVKNVFVKKDDMRVM